MTSKKSCSKKVFYDMFLLTALTQDAVALSESQEQRQKVVQRAIDLLNRAEKLVPKTRLQPPDMAGFHKQLGHDKQHDEHHARAKSHRAYSRNLSFLARLYPPRSRRGARIEGI